MPTQSNRGLFILEKQCLELVKLNLYDKKKRDSEKTDKGQSGIT